MRAAGRGNPPGSPGREGSARRVPRGMVTAELAVSLLSATVLVCLAAWVVGLVSLQGSCRSSASEIADQLARGDTAVAAKARRNVPQGATVSTSTSAGWVRVRVAAERSMGRVGPITVVGTASAPLEPGQTP